MPYRDPIKRAENRKKHREKDRARAREHERLHPEMKRERNLRRVGWTIERFEAFFKDQNGLCAICSEPISKEAHKPNSATCDHDHITEQPRGLLCDRCNRIEGCLAKSSLTPREWITALEIYLNKYSKGS